MRLCLLVSQAFHIDAQKATFWLQIQLTELKIKRQIYIENRVKLFTHALHAPYYWIWLRKCSAWFQFESPLVRYDVFTQNRTPSNNQHKRYFPSCLIDFLSHKISVCSMFFCLSSLFFSLFLSLVVAKHCFFFADYPQFVHKRFGIVSRVRWKTNSIRIAHGFFLRQEIDLKELSMTPKRPTLTQLRLHMVIMLLCANSPIMSTVYFRLFHCALQLFALNVPACIVSPMIKKGR